MNQYRIELNSNYITGKKNTTNYFTSCDPHHDMSGHVSKYIWTYLEYILTFHPI